MSYTMHNQVNGGASTLVMYPETAPGKPGNTGYLLPIASENLALGITKNDRSLLTGKRGKGKPFPGLGSPSGQVVMGASAPHLGLILRGLCGTPTTSTLPAKPLSNAPAVDKGDGTVQVPCASHGFRPWDVVSVIGTTHYDGVYEILPESTSDALCIAAPYAVETFAAGTVSRGRRALFAGTVADKTGGKVGLPVINNEKDGVPHTFRAGDSIAVSGTTNYDATYTIVSATDDEIVVTADYVAETIEDDGTAAGLPVFASHAFSLPQKQPMLCFEKYFDFDTGAADYAYQRFSFAKVEGLSFDLGGDGELTLSIDVLPGSRKAAAVPLADSPIEYPMAFIDKPGFTLFVNGERRGEINTASFSAKFNISPQSAVGDGLNYSRMPEGDPEVSLSMSCFLENDWMQGLSDANATVPLAIYGAGNEGDSLTVTLPECVLDTEGPSISGKEGLKQDVTAKAFVDASESVLSFTLINRVLSYA